MTYENLVTEKEVYNGTRFNQGGPCQQIGNDHWVDILTPSPYQMHIEDIRTSLCRQPRYMGHTAAAVPYTVGQHCWLVSKMMERDGYDEHTVKWAFAHDWSEHIMGDMSSPMKRALEVMLGKGVFKDTWGAIEDGINQAIAERFDLEMPIPADVKLYDYIALATEKRDLMLCTRAWGNLPDPHPAFHVDNPWTEGFARRRFKDRFIELWGENMWEITL